MGRPDPTTGGYGPPRVKAKSVLGTRRPPTGFRLRLLSEWLRSFVVCPGFPVGLGLAGCLGVVLVLVLVLVLVVTSRRSGSGSGSSSGSGSGSSSGSGGGGGSGSGTHSHSLRTSDVAMR